LKQSDPFGVLQKASVAILLTWVAGFVDIIGYFYLYGVYTAHMSGNTVAMARHLSQSQLIGVARNGWPIATFVIGLIIGAIVFEAEKRGTLRLPCPGTLLLESLAIGASIAVGVEFSVSDVVPHQPALKFYLMVALLAASMGVQNVTIRKIGGVNIYTTFVTGSLVKFGEAVSSYLFWLHDYTRGRFRQRIGSALRASFRQRSMQHLTFTAGLWISYLAGGVCGAYADHLLKLLCLIFPLIVLVGLTLYGTVWPFVLLAEEEW
jgi:uncharacterized membrane protein YoaK (UPF0700 family)